MHHTACKEKKATNFTLDVFVTLVKLKLYIKYIHMYSMYIQRVVVHIYYSISHLFINCCVPLCSVKVMMVMELLPNGDLRKHLMAIRTE